jgi:hypothetical protein
MVTCTITIAVILYIYSVYGIVEVNSKIICEFTGVTQLRFFWIFFMFKIWILFNFLHNFIFDIEINTHVHNISWNYLIGIDVTTFLSLSLVFHTQSSESKNAVWRIASYKILAKPTVVTFICCFLIDFEIRLQLNSIILSLKIFL